MPGSPASSTSWPSPACALRQRHALQPRREVRRLADDAALLRLAGADQVADHDEAGGDADSGFEPDPQLFWRIEPADPLDQREPGTSRALGIVLICQRISKINQRAVAHVFGDKPAEPADLLGDRGVIGADHLAQI